MAESLDLKSLRVVDLKEELGKRNLSKNGKKDELLARLTEALAQEATATAPGVEEAPTTAAPTAVEEVPVPAAPAPEATVATDEDKAIKTSVNNKDTTSKDTPADSATSTTANKPLPVENAKAAPPSTSAPLESATTIEAGSVNVSEDSAVSKDRDEKSNSALKRKHEEDLELQQDKRSKPTEVESTPQDDKATATSTGTTPITETKPGETSPTAPDTNSSEQLAICIKGFVRPLITRNLHQFISDFGSIERFWIDPIKTHCYVIYETLEQAATAFEKIDGAVYPPSTGKNVSVIRLTSTQAAKLMDREQEVAEKHGRVNWEKLMERVLNNEDIDESPSTEQGAKGSSPASNVKRRLGGLEQITRQLQQRGAVSAIMDQEQQQPSVSILDRLSSSTNAQISFSDSADRPAATALPATGKSLDELFLKTKTYPSLYYLPVDNETAAKRLKAMKSK